MLTESEIFVSTKDIFPIMMENIRNGESVIFTISGNSMRPFLADNRDQVMLSHVEGKTLKPADIVLFQNEYGKYILHRISKIIGDNYLTIGDACLNYDGIIQKAQIIGVVNKLYRKGKEMDCSSFLWRFIFTAWIKLLPIRKYLLDLYFLILKVKHKGKKM